MIIDCPFADERIADELIRDAIAEDETPLSNCCGAKFWLGETDFCTDCGEHASAEIPDFQFPGSANTHRITYDPETRELISFELVGQFKTKEDL